VKCVLQVKGRGREKKLKGLRPDVKFSHLDPLPSRIPLLLLMLLFCRVNLSSARRATSFFSLHQPVDAPLIPFNMPYDDAHRALVQAFLGRRVMTVDEAKPVFAAILSVASKEFRCSPSTAPSR
jgi:hypothetical protein